MIKTIGKWVAFLPLVEESASGIKSESLDKGTVLFEMKEVTNGLKVGDKIHFDINKVAHKSGDYWVIDIDYIYGVVE
jgi:hypothetical protein